MNIDLTNFALIEKPIIVKYYEDTSFEANLFMLDRLLNCSLKDIVFQTENEIYHCVNSERIPSPALVAFKPDNSKSLSRLKFQLFLDSLQEVDVKVESRLTFNLKNYFGDLSCIKLNVLTIVAHKQII